MIHAEDDLIENIIWCRAQVVNLAQHFQLKQNELILVILQNMRFEALIILWIVTNHIAEPLFRHLGKCVVIHTRDSRSSLESIVATNLSKVISFTESTHHFLIALVVPHSHLAFTLTNEVEVWLFVLVKLFILHDHISMWDMQLSVDITHDCRQERITPLLIKLGRQGNLLAVNPLQCLLPLLLQYLIVLNQVISFFDRGILDFNLSQEDLSLHSIHQRV